MDIKDIRDKNRKRYHQVMERAMKDGTIDEELNERQRINDESIAKARGNILNRMIEIEHELNIYLQCSLFGFMNGKGHIFSDEILDKEWFTMSKKIQLFKKVAYHLEEQFNNRYVGADDLLSSLNKRRNLVAHGIKVHFTNPELALIGKGNVEKLDKEFMDKFDEDCELMFYILIELIDSIKDAELKSHQYK